MAITDQRVILFCNESVRTFSEELRALMYKARDIKLKWDTEIAPECPVSPTEFVEDGREAQGVSRLSGNDVALTMGMVNNIVTLANGTGVMEVIEKPCVRPLVTG